MRRNPRRFLPLVISASKSWDAQTRRWLSRLLFGISLFVKICPLLGVKRTSAIYAEMSAYDPKRTSSEETIPSSHLNGSARLPRRWRHCKTTAFRAAWSHSATPDASTCSSLVTCQCHFAPRCQMRQSNIGSAKRNSRSQAGAAITSAPNVLHNS